MAKFLTPPCPCMSAMGSMAAVIDVAEIVVSLGSLRVRLDVEWLQSGLAGTARLLIQLLANFNFGPYE